MLSNNVVAYRTGQKFLGHQRIFAPKCTKRDCFNQALSTGRLLRPVERRLYTVPRNFCLLLYTSVWLLSYNVVACSSVSHNVGA